MTKEVVVEKYIADEGLVFDWVDPHYHIEEDGTEVRDHLYVDVLFIGRDDDISNYMEVEAPANEDTK